MPPPPPPLILLESLSNEKYFHRRDARLGKNGKFQGSGDADSRQPKQSNKQTKVLCLTGTEWWRTGLIVFKNRWGRGQPDDIGAINLGDEKFDPDSDKKPRAGQILWIRGLTRLQTQVTIPISLSFSPLKVNILRSYHKDYYTMTQANFFFSFFSGNSITFLTYRKYPQSKYYYFIFSRWKENL